MRITKNQKSKKIIALLTDFGNKDGFVGSLKAVILSINPNIEIVDISHEVESFSILEASIILNATYKYFPKGTIFLSVVDPGVGTEREAIIVKTENYIFVSPNNGILTLPLKNEKIKEIVKIENKKYILKSDTNTFHGRDIFAPVSAYISRGIALKNFGKKLKKDNLVIIKDIYPEEKEDRIIGKVIKFDKFGNAITNIDKLPENSKILFRNYQLKICNNFQEGDKYIPSLIKGSFGFYEIFLKENSAKDILNINLFEEFIILK